MQQHSPTYVIAGTTRRSLGQMIREQEMRKTIRILNPGGPKPRQRSFSERYRGTDYASRTHPTDRD